MANGALIITDGKPGHENQSLALCDALGLEPRRLPVHYPRFGKALSYAFDRLGVCYPGLFRTDATPPDPADVRLLVGAGSTAYYPLKCLARRLHRPAVAVLAPRGYRLDFACIIVPEYDRPPHSERVVRIPVNLCRLDPAFYADRAAEFATGQVARKPAAGFVIGGDSALSRLDASVVKKQIEQAMALLPEHEFWVTTSRRTPEAVDAVIDALPFDYSLVYRRTPDVNPTPAFIGACDRLFVTGDSASMISESVCFGGAAVEILPPQYKRADNKFARLVSGLQARGAAHVFDGTLGNARNKINLRAHLGEVARKLET